tara:strand:+ start:86 stop:196 length:111 start_codon:yes stop_codon:yes gene_type:complete
VLVDAMEEMKNKKAQPKNAQGVETLISQVSDPTELS